MTVSREEVEANRQKVVTTLRFADEKKIRCAVMFKHGDARCALGLLYETLGLPVVAESLIPAERLLGVSTLSWVWKLNDELSFRPVPVHEAVSSRPVFTFSWPQIADMAETAFKQADAGQGTTASALAQTVTSAPVLSGEM